MAKMYWNANEDMFAPVDFDKPVTFEYKIDEMSRTYRKHYNGKRCKSTIYGDDNYSMDRIMDAYNESKYSDCY